MQITARTIRFLCFVFVVTFFVSVESNAKAQTSRLFDEYGNSSSNAIKHRLDAFALELQNDPTSRGVIISLGTTSTTAKRRSDLVRTYLVNTRNIDAGRLIFKNKKCAKTIAKLFITPAGSDEPAPDCN